MENRKLLSRIGVLCIASAWILIFTRCGSSPDPEPASGTFSNVYKTFQKKGCTECHTPGGAGFTAGSQLNLSSQATAYTSLTTLNVTATASVGTCGTVKLVSSGQPNQSYLTAVLLDSYNTSNFGGVTGCSPFNGHLTSSYTYSDAEKTSLVDWITNGAKND